MRYPWFREQGLFVGSGVVEGRLQDRDRLTPQAFRYVLDRARRQRDHRSALLPDERKVRGLLGGPINRRLISHIYVAHPVRVEHTAELARPATIFSVLELSADRPRDLYWRKR